MKTLNLAGTITSASTIAENAISNKDQSLLIGLRITIPKKIDKKKVAEYLQEQYFDELGSSGYFRLMPESERELANWSYLDANHPFSDEMFDKSVKHIDDTTVAELLLGQISFESEDETVCPFEEELRCTSEEINLFLNQGLISSWDQFPLN